MIPKNFILDSSLKDRLNLIGETFTRLTCKSVAGYSMESYKRRTCYLFDCSCGNTCIIRGKDVQRGATKSCGCLALESSSQNGKANKKVGFNDRPAFLRYYKQYQSAANRRGLEFSLDKEAFREITSSRCHYCNLQPSKEYAKNWSGYNTVYVANGIDRKDNNQGYTKANSLPCCSTCNRAKHTLSYDEFIDWLRRIASFQSESLNN